MNRLKNPIGRMLLMTCFFFVSPVITYGLEQPGVIVAKGWETAADHTRGFLKGILEEMHPAGFSIAVVDSACNIVAP